MGDSRCGFGAGAADDGGGAGGGGARNLADEVNDELRSGVFQDVHCLVVVDVDARQSVDGDQLVAHAQSRRLSWRMRFPIITPAVAVALTLDRKLFSGLSRLDFVPFFYSTQLLVISQIAR